VEKAELLNVNRSAVETYLNCGDKEDFEEFFEAYIQPLGETAIKSYLIKNYLFMDVVLATAKMVNELGGNIDTLIPELNSIETILSNIKTAEQLKAETGKVLVAAMIFRTARPVASMRRSSARRRITSTSITWSRIYPSIRSHPW